MHLAVNQKKINNAPRLNLTDSKLFQKRKEQVPYADESSAVCVS